MIIGAVLGPTALGYYVIAFRLLDALTDAFTGVLSILALPVFARLKDEVTLLRHLKHDNIVQYLGTEVTGDSINIFLEYVPGGSIASLLAKFGAFQVRLRRRLTDDQ